MRDCKADRLVQLDLSFFSISKLILLVRARYPLKGIARRVELVKASIPTPPLQLIVAWGQSGVHLKHSSFQSGDPPKPFS